jgi:hypothetical protein
MRYKCSGMYVSVAWAVFDESKSLNEDCLGFLTLKTKALRSFEPSGTTRQKWQHHIPECMELSPHSLIRYMTCTGSIFTILPPHKPLFKPTPDAFWFQSVCSKLKQYSVLIILAERALQFSAQTPTALQLRDFVCKSWYRLDTNG